METRRPRPWSSGCGGWPRSRGSRRHSWRWRGCWPRAPTSPRSRAPSGATTWRRTRRPPASPSPPRTLGFLLSNCANSGIHDVCVVQQYLPHALEDHLANGRPWDLDRTQGGLLILQPFTGGEEGGLHTGNADSLWRHRLLITEYDADVVLVLSADAVTRSTTGT